MDSYSRQENLVSRIESFRRQCFKKRLLPRKTLRTISVKPESVFHLCWKPGYDIGIKRFEGERTTIHTRPEIIAEVAIVLSTLLWFRVFDPQRFGKKS
jgi:hypothetical protein